MNSLRVYVEDLFGVVKNPRLLGPGTYPNGANRACRLKLELAL